VNLELDHVAVQSSDIAASVAWYTTTCGATILYQDSTWAMLQIGKGKLALVSASQHPNHIGLRIDAADLDSAAQSFAGPLENHRDGTRGLYIKDPDGNTIELISYPQNSKSD